MSHVFYRSVQLSDLALGLTILLAGTMTAPLGAADFLWGVANSAFQVEGFPVDSDWKRWTHSAGRIHDATNADRATEFWTRYDTDFELAQGLGSNAFRISIAWERIEPKEGVWDSAALAHYETMIVAMRKRGLEPIVTLHHFVLPAWLSDRGGTLATDFPRLFARYAEHVVRRLSKAPARVEWWMTFNEPMVLVNNGFLDGSWPPGHKNDASGAMKTAANLARAHVEAIRLIRRFDEGRLKFSVATHHRIFQPGSSMPWDRTASRLTNWAFNWQFLRAVHTGQMKFWMPGSRWISEKLDLPNGRSTLDYIGLNYYGRSIIKFGWKPPFLTIHEGPGPKSDLGWEMYPEGFRTAIRELNDELDLPVLVTENGVADAQDQFRPGFLKDHLQALLQAKREGASIIGYLHWSLTDNFEWAKGEEPRFGLVAINYATQERSLRPSYKAYQQLIRELRVQGLK